MWNFFHNLNYLINPNDRYRSYISRQLLLIPDTTYSSTISLILKNRPFSKESLAFSNIRASRNPAETRSCAKHSGLPPFRACFPCRFSYMERTERCIESRSSSAAMERCAEFAGSGPEAAPDLSTDESGDGETVPVTTPFLLSPNRAKSSSSAASCRNLEPITSFLTPGIIIYDIYKIDLIIFHYKI